MKKLMIIGLAIVLAGCGKIIEKDYRITLTCKTKTEVLNKINEEIDAARTKGMTPTLIYFAGEGGDVFTIKMGFSNENSTESKQVLQ